MCTELAFECLFESSALSWLLEYLELMILRALCRDCMFDGEFWAFVYSPYTSELAFVLAVG